MFWIKIPIQQGNDISRKNLGLRLVHILSLEKSMKA